MNWVGGVRSRIKLQNDKKKQKEFFERKRYENKVQQALENQSVKNRKKLSQDLLALSIVTKANIKSQKNDIMKQKKRGTIKAVDLDKVTPGHKRIPEELDLGPISPINRQFVLGADKKESCCVQVQESEPLTNVHVKSVSAKKNDIWSNDSRFDTDSYVTPDKFSCHDSKMVHNHMSVFEKNRCNFLKNKDKQNIQRQGDSTEHVLSSLEPVTPLMKYGKFTTQNKVTFSNKVTTRTQTPSPLYDSWTNKYKKSSVSSKLNIPLKRHWPLWEQDTPILQGKFKNAGCNRYPEDTGIGGIEKENQSDTHHAHHTYTSSKDIFFKTFEKKNSYSIEMKENKTNILERNRKRDIAHIHEDFQVTPLKKYIRKRDQRQSIMLNNEEVQINQQKLERNRLEDIVEKNPVLSMVNDGIFNKIQSSINPLFNIGKDIGASKEKERPLATGTKLEEIVNENHVLHMDDGEIFNKTNTSINTNCKDETGMHKYYKGTNVIKIQNHDIQSLLDDSTYNKIVSKIDWEGEAQLSYKNERIETSDASVFKTPVQSSKSRPQSVTKTPRGLGWMEFISGKANTKDRKQHLSREHMNTMSCEEDTPFVMKNCKSAAEEAFEELLLLENECEKQIKHDLDFEEELHLEFNPCQQTDDKNNIYNNTLNVALPSIDDFYFIESILKEVISKVCYLAVSKNGNEEKSAETSSNLIQCEVKINLSDNNDCTSKTPLQYEEKPESVSVCVGTEDFTNKKFLNNVETQTEYIKPKFKETSAQCLLLKGEPVTVNEFTQTDLEKDSFQDARTGDANLSSQRLGYKMVLDNIVEKVSSKSTCDNSLIVTSKALLAHNSQEKAGTVVFVQNDSNDSGDYSNCQVKDESNNSNKLDSSHKSNVLSLVHMATDVINTDVIQPKLRNMLAKYRLNLCCRHKSSINGKSVSDQVNESNIFSIGNICPCDQTILNEDPLCTDNNNFVKCTSKDIICSSLQETRASDDVIFKDKSETMDIYHVSGLEEMFHNDSTQVESKKNYYKMDKSTFFKSTRTPHVIDKVNIEQCIKSDGSLNPYSDSNSNKSHEVEERIHKSNTKTNKNNSEETVQMRSHDIELKICNEGSNYGPRNVQNKINTEGGASVIILETTLGCIDELDEIEIKRNIQRFHNGTNKVSSEEIIGKPNNEIETKGKEENDNKELDVRDKISSEESSTDQSNTLGDRIDTNNDGSICSEGSQLNNLDSLMTNSPSIKQVKGGMLIEKEKCTSNCIGFENNGELVNEMITQGKCNENVFHVSNSSKGNSAHEIEDDTCRKDTHSSDVEICTSNDEVITMRDRYLYSDDYCVVKTSNTCDQKIYEQTESDGIENTRMSKLDKKIEINLNNCTKQSVTNTHCLSSNADCSDELLPYMDSSGGLSGNCSNVASTITNLKSVVETQISVLKEYASSQVNEQEYNKEIQESMLEKINKKKVCMEILDKTEGVDFDKINLEVDAYGSKQNKDFHSVKGTSHIHNLDVNARNTLTIDCARQNDNKVSHYSTHDDMNQGGCILYNLRSRSKVHKSYHLK